MKVLLTSSKTLDYTSPLTLKVTASTPQFIHDAEIIRQTLQGFTTKEVKNLQQVSNALAEQAVRMNTDSNPPTRPALWAYKGDVYKGLQAETLTRKSADWMQAYVRIPSGLYGLLRPFDEIIPYRLEMKTRLVVSSTKDLYAFWGARLARAIPDDEVVVLASDEYARAVTRYLAKRQTVYDVSFMDAKNQQHVKVPIYNKVMRGVMTRWMADHAVSSPQILKQFVAHGYRFDSEKSTTTHFVYTRKTSAPIRP